MTNIQKQSLFLWPREQRLKSLLSWEPVNECTITARLQTRFLKCFSVILKPICSPMNTKMYFTINYQAWWSTWKWRSNSTWGETHRTMWSIQCVHSQHVFFSGKDIHTVTWNSADNRTKKQIDHFVVNNRCRSSIQDARAYRGAGVGSDHRLCIAIVKMEFKRVTSLKEMSKKNNSKRLNEASINEQFQLELSKGFSPLQFLEAELVGCLTSQQQASVSQGRICSDNFTCCHTEIEVADQTFYLTQSQYTDTGPTSPSADPVTPGAWQGSHWSANFWVTGMNRPGKIPSQAGHEPRTFRSRGGRLNH